MESKITIAFTKNSEVSFDLKKEIIGVKAEHWNYTFSEHSKWMDENLTEDDVHIILYVDSEIAGYANLVYRDLLNIEKTKVVGVGNVCVSKKYENKGIGTFIMNSITFFLKERNLIGLLFCKDSLTPFYSKSGWREYTGSIYDQFEQEISHKCFFINGSLEDKITLLGKLF